MSVMCARAGVCVCMCICAHARACLYLCVCVCVCVPPVCACGPTQEEHDKRLSEVLCKLQEAGLTMCKMVLYTMLNIISALPKVMPIGLCEVPACFQLGLACVKFLLASNWGWLV